MRIFILTLLLTISVYAKGSPTSKPVELVPTVIDEIQSTFKKIQTIETRFKQTVKSARFGEKKSSGKLNIQRPGKMIWNYDDPKGKIFSANGDIITLYDPEDNQALVSPQPKNGRLPAGLSFLMGNSNLTDYFFVEVVNDSKNVSGHREVKLLCKPRGEVSEFKELELVFEWSPELVLTMTRTTDLLNSENQIDFKDMKLNRRFSSKIFDVKLPKNVPVVTSNAL